MSSTNDVVSTPDCCHLLEHPLRRFIKCEWTQSQDSMCQWMMALWISSCLYHECYTYHLAHYYQCISSWNCWKIVKFSVVLPPRATPVYAGSWKFMPGWLCITWPAITYAVAAYSYPQCHLCFTYVTGC